MRRGNWRTDFLRFVTIINLRKSIAAHCEVNSRALWMGSNQSTQFFCATKEFHCHPMAF